MFKATTIVLTQGHDTWRIKCRVEGTDGNTEKADD